MAATLTAKGPRNKLPNTVPTRFRSHRGEGRGVGCVQRRAAIAELTFGGCDPFRSGCGVVSVFVTTSSDLLDASSEEGT